MKYNGKYDPSYKIVYPLVTSVSCKIDQFDLGDFGVFSKLRNSDCMIFFKHCVNTF